MHLFCFQVTSDNMDGNSLQNFDLTTQEGVNKWQEALQFMYHTNQYAFPNPMFYHR